MLIKLKRRKLMNSLKQQIIDYRNNHKESRLILGVLLSELDRDDKIKEGDFRNPSDNDVIRIIKKMIESNKLINTTESLYENQLLEQFIPQQLTEEQIENIIRMEKFVNIKDCMTFFKELYPGLYDGKIVSNCFKNV